VHLPQSLHNAQLLRRQVRSIKADVDAAQQPSIQKVVVEVAVAGSAAGVAIIKPAPVVHKTAVVAAVADTATRPEHH
jgi:hypothetical protein